MKNLFKTLTIILLNVHCFSQEEVALPDSLLISIDSSLMDIQQAVSSLENEYVDKEEEPFTGQSIFEDRKGMSAIFLPNGGSLRLNMSDASVRLSFTSYKIGSKKPYFGFSVSGKSNENLTSLFSKGNIAPGAKLEGIMGWDAFNISKGDKKQKLGRLALKLGYEGASFKLFQENSLFENQITKQSFNTFTTSISFNLKIGGNLLLGASIGYQKTNNYADLDEIVITDTHTEYDSTSNINRSHKEEFKLRTGSFTIQDQFPINVDLYWVPKNSPRLGIYHFWRTKFTNGDAKSGFGSGLYLLKKNNPLSSIAGVVFEVDDITALSDGFGRNLSVNFVTSFNFGFKSKK